MPAVEDLVNQALTGIGYKRPIADIFEGSAAARAAVEIYGQTRDELLQEEDWPFALREVALATNGQTPPSPWGKEYAYPTDCLRIRTVKPTPLTLGARSLDPKPVLWRSFNDNRVNPAVRAILSDEPQAVLIYTGRVTDPATWEPEFTKSLIDRLAMKLSFKLAADPNLVKARIMIAEEPAAEVTDMKPPMQMPISQQAPGG